MIAFRNMSLVALMLGSSVPASADGLQDRLSFSGLLELEFAMSVPSGEVAKTQVTLSPEAGFEITRSTRLTIIGRARSEDTDLLEPGQPLEPNRSDATRRSFASEDLEFELREVYIDTEVGETYLRIGKQQVVWGQADGLKVLDVLNPQSFREFILDDFEDSRIPLWSLNAEVPVGAAFLQLVWLPDTTYDDLPEAGASFAFTSQQFVPAAPPGASVTFAPIDKPDDAFADSDVAVQLSGLLGGWDVSVNYAYHYFDRPVIRRSISGTDVVVSQTWERTHLVGGTLSNVFGDFILRGEIGFSSNRFYLTDTPLVNDGILDSPEVSYVLGLDYQGWSDWFISGQLFQSWVPNPVDSLVRDEIDTTATLLMRRDFMNEALQAEVQFIHSLNNSDGVIQIGAKYELRDNVQLRAGVDVFYGEAFGLFGQFDKLDRISVGVQVGF